MCKQKSSMSVFPAKTQRSNHFHLFLISLRAFKYYFMCGTLWNPLSGLCKGVTNKHEKIYSHQEKLFLLQESCTDKFFLEFARKRIEKFLWVHHSLELCNGVIYLQKKFSCCFFCVLNFFCDFPSHLKAFPENYSRRTIFQRVNHPLELCNGRFTYMKLRTEKQQEKLFLEPEKFFLDVA